MPRVDAMPPTRPIVLLSTATRGGEYDLDGFGFRTRARMIIYLCYDKVPETSLLFSLFCTVFAIWKHLEAFGY